MFYMEGLKMYHGNSLISTHKVKIFLKPRYVANGIIVAIRNNITFFSPIL